MGNRNGVEMGKTKGEFLDAVQRSRGSKEQRINKFPRTALRSTG